MSGKKLKEIASELKCSEGTVRYTLKRFELTGSHENCHRSGRKPLLSKNDTNYLALCSVRNRRKTVRQLTTEFNAGRDKPVSRRTVLRALAKAGLNGRIAARKPLLRKANIKKRLQWAKAHVHWTLEQWYRVLWTDESKVELFGSKRQVFVRRRKGERFRSFCLVPTMKHGGGSIMIWAAISAHGAAPLKRIVGIMEQKMYHGILVHHAIPAGKRLLGQPFVFMEDNDPKHSSKLCRSYIGRQEEKGILILFFHSFSLYIQKFYK